MAVRLTSADVAAAVQVDRRALDLEGPPSTSSAPARRGRPDSHPELAANLIAKAQAGTKIRVAIGDPASSAVRIRGEEEAIGDDLAARARLSFGYLREAVGTPGVDVRMHTTTLYNSIYRFDNDMLVNTHVYGAPAVQSPVLHFRRLAGGRVFDHYEQSFERVWEQATAPDSLLGR